ncbi:MAG: hypothetical protein SGPRY_005893 [Prymnesium sp.]
MARLLTGLALHALLREVQRDPEGLVLRSLPPPIRRLLRRHLKWPANALVDLIASTLLPIGQRRSLRAIRGEEHSVGEGLVVEVFRTHAPAGAPLLLFVHGGIWTLGNRYQYRGIGQRAAVEGMVGVVLGYRTWPEANASEQASSVRAALAFVREHAARWGADEKRVYLSGQSSGANVSALALMEGGGVSCAGLIGMGGCYDVSEHFEYESRRGVEQVSMLEVACAPFHAHSPTLLLRQRPARLACDRVLLMHGERDVVVPPSSSALFAVELAKVGQQVTYHDEE